MRRFSKAGLLALALGVGLVVPGQASASLILNFSNSFSGTPDPNGPAPWLTATFTNNGANHVTLTLQANLSLATEFVDSVYFNVNPSSLLDLTITPAIGNAAVVDSAIWSQAVDEFKADGDGKYDLLLELAQSGNRFTGTETLVFDLSSTGLTEDSFNALSAPAGGSGPFVAASHVQGLAFGQSTWLYATAGNNPVVPEPATILSAVTGLVSMGFFGLRRRRQAAGVAA